MRLFILNWMRSSQKHFSLFESYNSFRKLQIKLSYQKYFSSDMHYPKCIASLRCQKLYPFETKQYYNQRKDNLDHMKSKNPIDIAKLAHSLLSDVEPTSIPTATFLSMSKQITELLFQLRILHAESLMLEIFNEIVKKNMQLDSSYTIVMRYYADKKDYENVYKYYNKLKDDPNVEITARCYVPLICVSIQTRRYDEAFSYLENLNRNLKAHFQYHLYADIISTCAEHLRQENHEQVSTIVKNMLDVLECYGATYLTESVAEALKHWFSRNQEWNCVETSIGKKNGICQYCKRSIGKAVIPPDRRLQLRRNLMALIKVSLARKKASKLGDIKIDRTNKIVKKKVVSQAKYFDIYDTLSMSTPSVKEDVSETVDGYFGEETFSVLKGLKELLDNNKPFDVVIDVLNVGYFAQGFNPIQIRNVVQHFIKRNQKILILCAGLLKEELLQPNIEIPPSRIRIQALLRYLNHHCQLYFVESSIIDDYYILYTLIHHDFNINLVSRDRFKDHLYHLNAQNVSDFKTWQQTNQYVFKALDNHGNPVFESRPSYRTSVHSHETGWHIPIDKKQWLCVEKNIQNE